jgi:NADP-dependent 3-hydroxy acid dehydrogenase YdfG
VLSFPRRPSSRHGTNCCDRGPRAGPRGVLAERFAEEGCSVALLARSASDLEDLAGRLTGETDGEAVAVPTDLSAPEEIETALEEIYDAVDPVDVLVNHASTATWDGLLEQDAEDFRRALAVGPEAALHCTQAAPADMLDGDGGTIIFTGATSAVRGRAGALGFSAAKFACRGMAESMARELGPLRASTSPTSSSRAASSHHTGASTRPRRPSTPTPSPTATGTWSSRTGRRGRWNWTCGDTSGSSSPRDRPHSSVCRYAVTS